MPNKIQIRRGLKANLPTLSAGEPGFTTDTKEVFIGTGTENIELATRTYVDQQINFESQAVLKDGSVPMDDLTIGTRKDGSIIGTNSFVQGATCEASAPRSNAHGYSTIASGNQSHAEGNITKAYGENSHAEGNATQAIGVNSHAEGLNNIASGYCAHVEGQGSVAGYTGTTTPSADDTVGLFSHAEGNGTMASGNSSHTEGKSTIASGIASHSEGFGTDATEHSAHAEGYDTTASGAYSHSEGFSTQAIGVASHAGGSGSIAQGDRSFVHGRDVTANGADQTVFGKYNATSTTDLFQVGMGTSNSARKNALAITSAGKLTGASVEDTTSPGCAVGTITNGGILKIGRLVIIDVQILTNQVINAGTIKLLNSGIPVPACYYGTGRLYRAASGVGYEAFVTANNEVLAITGVSIPSGEYINLKCTYISTT